jgi:hypothetical protein
MSTTPIQLPDVEPPKYYSPFDARAKLMNLQNLALQQQEGQQNLQLGQMKIAEQQRLATAGQKMRDVFANAPDLRSALPDVYKIDPVMGMSMTKSLHEQEKSALDMETARIGANVKKAERLASLAGSANDEDSFHRAIATALDEKMMSPQEAQQALAEGWGPQSQAHMQQITQMGLSAKEQAEQHLANLKEQRDAMDAQHKRDMAPYQVAEAQNTARKTGLEADELQRKLDMIKNTKPADVLALVDGVVPPDVKANRALNLRTKIMVSAKLQQGDFAGAQDVIKTAAAEMRQLEVATDPRVQAGKINVAIQGAVGRENAIANASGIPTPATGAAAAVHGDEYLKTLQPAFAAQLKQMATGDVDAPTGRAATSGPGARIMNALMQYDPEYSKLLAQQRKENLHQFNDTHPGSAGGQLIALNTMIHHADLYLDAAAALKNGSFKPGNEIYNKVATIFGAAPPTNAALLAQFFASETGKVATGGVPAEGEIKSILSKMSTDGSPEAMEGAAKTLIQIAGGRMLPLKQRRDDAHLEKFVRILDPQSTETLQKRGFDPETMKPVQRGGGGGTPPLIKTKAEYDNLPSGTVYTESNGKTYRKP